MIRVTIWNKHIRERIKAEACAVWRNAVRRAEPDCPNATKPVIKFDE